jgi:DNA-binding MarR family transcriptional regulator
MATSKKTAAQQAVEQVDAACLERLLGYNLRRATLAVLESFHERMAVFGLRPVEFSVLTLIHHNPGITARQLCASLAMQPPNLVGPISSFEQRQLIRREPHASDRRALGLHLTAAGLSLMQQAEAVAVEAENLAGSALSAKELAALMKLLRRLYPTPA